MEDRFPFAMSNISTPITADVVDIWFPQSPGTTLPPVLPVPLSLTAPNASVQQASSSDSPSPSPPVHELLTYIGDTSTNSTPLSSSPIQPTHAPPSRPITRSQNNIFKPKTPFSLNVSKHPIPPALEPTCVSQAIKDSHWREAMDTEFNAIIRNGTWDLVSNDGSKNLVGCKWVFRIKRHPDGSINRYKARLAAKGFHQRPGIDFTETFSPVVKPTTIRVVLCFALTCGWPLKQLDVNNAFLQGTLEDEVYMVQPPGFVHSQFPNHICKLKKTLYGLKQAPRAWYRELSTFLLANGFNNAISDASLFIYNSNGIQVYIIFYVDDIVVTGNNNAFLETFLENYPIVFLLRILVL